MRKRKWIRFGVALAMGALVPLAFPPFDWPIVYWLVWPVIVRLIDVMPPALGWRARLRSGAWIGYGFGIGQFAVGLSWIGNAFEVNAEAFGWLEPIALAAIAFGLALFPAAAGAAAAAFWRKDAARLGVLALAWTALEWLRGHILTGFPWNLAGVAFIANDATLQADALIGPYGLSLLAVLIGAAPILLFDRPVPRRAFAALATLLALIWLYGVQRLAAPDPPNPGLRLRIVQPDIPESKSWSGAEVREAFRGLVELTRMEGHYDVVIWPEAAIHAVLDREPQALDVLGQELGPDHLLITGTFRIAPQDHFYNSIDVVNGNGAIVATYDKAHLVPFGEYLPFRRLFNAIGLRGLAESLPGGMAEGPGRKTWILTGVPPASPLVCYEILFSGEVVASEPERPRWIVNVTNDVWFGRSIGPHQHFGQVRMRAVEEGVPIARAANSGISAVIDAKGRVVRQLDLGTRGIFDADLPGALDPPPQSRGPIWLILAGLLALWAGLKQKRDPSALP